MLLMLLKPQSYCLYGCLPPLLLLILLPTPNPLGTYDQHKAGLFSLPCWRSPYTTPAYYAACCRQGHVIR
jgi:hypothetical protein